MGKKLIVFLAAFLFALPAIHTQIVYAAEYPGPLVSMDWVQENLNTISSASQTEIRLVEVSSKGYDKEHIPGAVNIKWGSEVFGPATDHMLPDYAAMEAVMKKLGVTPDTHIVIYADKLDQATRFYWTLKYWNVEKISIMNGEKKEWKKEGRPLTSEVPAVNPLDYALKYPPNSKVNALLHPDITYGLATGKLLFVDARPAAYYEGKKFSLSKWVRSGHIPGAVNIAAPEDVTKGGKLLPIADLKKIFNDKGVTPDKSIVVYCNTGVRSSLSWFILHELLGYSKVKNYDGSIREYGNSFYLPMEPNSFNVYKNFPKTPLQEVKEATEGNAAKIAKLEKELAEVKKTSGKGICGPTALIALAMLPLGAYRLYRRRN